MRRAHRSLPLWALLLALGAPAAGQESGDADGRSTGEGVYSAAQAERGKKAFDAYCTNCHSAGQFAGGTFLKNWSGSTVGMVYDFLSGSMPQDAPGSLKPQEYADILAFFLKQNGFPAGSSELPSSSRALAAIRIESPAAGGR